MSESFMNLVNFRSYSGSFIYSNFINILKDESSIKKFLIDNSCQVGELDFNLKSYDDGDYVFENLTIKIAKVDNLASYDIDTQFVKGLEVRGGGNLPSIPGLSQFDDVTYLPDVVSVNDPVVCINDRHYMHPTVILLISIITYMVVIVLAYCKPAEGFRVIERVLSPLLRQFGLHINIFRDASFSNAPVIGVERFSKNKGEKKIDEFLDRFPINTDNPVRLVAEALFRGVVAVGMKSKEVRVLVVVSEIIYASNNIIRLLSFYFQNEQRPFKIIKLLRYPHKFDIASGQYDDGAKGLAKGGKANKHFIRYIKENLLRLH